MSFPSLIHPNYCRNFHIFSKSYMHKYETWNAAFLVSLIIPSITSSYINSFQYPIRYMIPVKEFSLKGSFSQVATSISEHPFDFPSVFLMEKFNYTSLAFEEKSAHTKRNELAWEIQSSAEALRSVDSEYILIFLFSEYKAEISTKFYSDFCSNELNMRIS